MAFTALATKAYKDPITTVWANSIKDNMDWLRTGVAKAWVSFDGSAAALSANASQNISSITDSGGGTYRINFTTGFVTTSIVPVGVADQGVGKNTVGTDSSGGVTTGFVRVIVRDVAGTPADSWVYMAFFGDLK